MKETLLAELRNKLSPIWNYLQIQKSYGDGALSSKDNNKSIIALILAEKQKAELAMPIVDSILKRMEQYDTPSHDPFYQEDMD